MISHITEALELDIPTKQKFLLICLCDAADQYGVCFPSVTTLSRYTSMPERTLQRALQDLMKREIVEVYWAFTEKTRHKKIRHFRLNLKSATRSAQPDYSNCSKELRSEVIARFEETCAYCSQKGTHENGPDGVAWHVDRIVPGSKGGLYVASNVALSCRECNSRKGAKLAPQITLSLGAILDREGCQTDASDGAISSRSGVPPVAPEALKGEPPEKHQGSGKQKPLETIARKLIEILALALTNTKIQTVEAAIVAEAGYRGCSIEDAARAIAQVAMQDRRRGVAIDRWYFEDTKWRSKSNGTGDKGQQYADRCDEEREILDQMLARATSV